MIILNKNILTIGGNRLEGGPLTPPTPPGPIPLPPNTVRVRTNDGNVPYKHEYATYQTATLVQGTTDVYDVYRSGTSLDNLLYKSTNIVELLGANTTGITNMKQMFDSCTSLTSVQLFDTSSVTNMHYMFNRCTSLTSVPLFDTSNASNTGAMFSSCSSLTDVPLFDTSNVTDMSYMFSLCNSITIVPLFNTYKVTNMAGMFAHCRYVQSGALALYQQASTQTNPPSKYGNTFYNCGIFTTTGKAELAQIPSSWGGTGA